MLNLAIKDNRERIIADINSNNNKYRKQVSLKQFEVYQGRMEQYVKENLLGQYNENTVREMPIVSTINVQRKIATTKASIYKHGVVRNFTELSDEQKEVIDLVYKDMMANVKLAQMNKNYVYQEQSIAQVVPLAGKLILRPFVIHQIDAIPNAENPDIADGFIISVFDRGEYLTESNFKQVSDTATGYIGRSNRDNTINNPAPANVATQSDYKGMLNKYIVWSKEYNFMMDGNGEVIDPATEMPTELLNNPLIEYNLLPFIEASREKDFEFFVRPSNALTDFTIQYNARMSDESAAIKLQAYNVAILKCPSELQPNIQVIGPAMLLKLPTDDPNKEVDFQFASPSSSINDISSANDKFLNNFLTSEGLTSSAINSGGSGEKFASALDRYIAILDRMEAHQDDYEVFKRVEDQLWKVVKAWLNTLSGTDKLDRKYWVPMIPEESEIEVMFEKPKMIRTEAEMLDAIQKKIDLGLMSKVTAIMKLEEVTEEKAREIYEQIKKDNDDEIVVSPSQMPIEIEDENSEEEAEDIEE